MLENKFMGFGVAGNFAGHLEQAGEHKDFVSVKTVEEIQPKAIFPFYIPSDKLSEEYQFLNINPISSNRTQFTKDEDNLQIEPEIALICDVRYENTENGKKVTALQPTHFAAFNDCSIRLPNVNKICKKKNWGVASKGLSSTLIPLDRFEQGGNIDHYNILCLLKRDGKLHDYGINSRAADYSYFHQKLLNWIIDCMNNQQDNGPMNNILDFIKQADYPEKAVITIGATRYTPYGESHFLRQGDTAMVIVYNAQTYSYEQIINMAEREHFNADISALVQKVN